MGVVDDLHRAREAYERREWVSAYRTLSDLDESDLTAGDFEALAITAYLLGQRNDCVQATQRAYQASADRGDVLAAVRSALWLWPSVLFEGGEGAIASGWVARAQRLLDEVEGDVVERGYLLQMQAFGHIMQGEIAEAAAVAPQVTDYGRRFHDPDLLAVGLHFEGRLAIYSGRVADGLRLLDEAMVGVLAGEVSPLYSGHGVLLRHRGLPGGLGPRPGRSSGPTPSPPGASPSRAWWRSPASAPCTAVS